MNNKKFKNPIITGFYPDPSICKAGDDFYLVSSSNQYYPGIPIFHSRDLVHWQQIGHVLDRPSQLNLDGAKPSGGIFAPTIRYKDGIFYVITTLSGNETQNRGNFIVMTDNPAGSWSDPYWLPDAPGIDPSLYFDDDGSVYVTGNQRIESSPYPSYREIWLQEINLKEMKMVGERKIILEQGALRDASFLEAPHIYKYNHMYYLIVAEGGTYMNHSVTVFRSNHIFGPYEGCKHNPVLTHRHLGAHYPITCIGHADLIETPNNEWWAVLLGTRPYKIGHYNIGREIFMVPVIWEEGWPIFSPGSGKVEFEYPLPNLPTHFIPFDSGFDPFDGDTLSDAWNFLRTPRGDFWSLDEKQGFLKLRCKKESLSEIGNPAFLGRRQQHSSFYASTVIKFEPAGRETAGMVLLQNHLFYLKMEILLRDHHTLVQLIQCEQGVEIILCEQVIPQGKVYLKAEGREDTYSFYYATDYGQWKTLMLHVDGSLLSTKVASGFLGTYIGVYASGNGTDSSNAAFFDWFDYKGIG